MIGCLKEKHLSEGLYKFLYLKKQFNSTKYNSFINYFLIFFYKILRKICNTFNVSFSFSSDGEDYVLFKIFNGIENGNYIDIGANHTILHSNTFSFYIAGWRGVCVDPIPSLVRKFKFFRSQDIFISAGLDSDGNNKSLPFYYYANHPDNSTFDIDRVKVLESLHSRVPTRVIDIPLVTVSQIIDKLTVNNDNTIVHLLSIDVEGMEKKILSSFFKSRILPWVVCVEDLGYLAQDIPKTSIHKLMVQNGYKLGMRTFLSSIYILKSKIQYLKSPFTNEWIK